jgi:hypothetical protein
MPAGGFPDGQITEVAFAADRPGSDASGFAQGERL